MKKLSLLLTITSLAILATTSFADYQDIAEEVETIVKVWVGGSLRETDNSKREGLADRQVPVLPEAAGRVGTSKGAEFYRDDSSASGGFLYKTAHLPQRIHLELDYFNDNEWYGDFRYSYLDYVQVRILPRRFHHNLDNLTVYDFSGPGDGSAEIEINDQGVEDYGLRLDIDQYRLRFKTPNFPLHIYGEGETVRRTGTQQARFLGGSAYFSELLRVTETREIDQENQAIAIGANTHLGPIEIDLSRKTRKFESDIATPTYDYSGFGSSAHNVTPQLEATINTLKIHTSHSGRLFASATLAEIDKENDYSDAEAKNTMGQGEIFWLPTTYLALTTKYRHQKNTASAPATVTGTNWLGGSTVYIVAPGVESTTDTAILSLRYTLIPKTSLNLKYTKDIKKVDDQSVLDWSNPPKTTKDEYEFALTNWLIPKVRTTARVIHNEVSSELTATSINNEPEQTDQFKLGITWAISPKVLAFGSAYFTREETEDNRLSGGITEANKAEALRQQHLLSLSFMVNDKLTISPSYTYISDEQGRDIVWDGAIDSNYTNEQVAHSYSLNMLLAPTAKTNINCSVDYTTTDGAYEPTSPFTGMFGAINTAEIAQFSQSSTEEINVRFDIDQDLGHGWGLGLDLRYTDWQDDSVDNPSDGEFMGGLLRISKVM
jgi:hypothetical protein